MAEEDLQAKLIALYQSVDEIKFCPWKPSPKQRAFLLLKGRQALYGGAARGGKSIATMMGALQYICVPGYNALIIRKQISDLDLQGGLIALSKVWFEGHGAWNGKTYTWTFPTSGKKPSTLGFGYLNASGDQYRYKGAEIQYYGLEEATEIADPEMAYYVESRLTLPEQSDDLEACKCHGWTLADVPLRFRLTSNPGGPGAGWVYNDFVRPAKEGEGGLFLPATVRDNPHVQGGEYVISLRNLSTVERERLLEGNWEVTEEGKMFGRKRFKYISHEEIPEEVWSRLAVIRFWDLASTKEKKGTNPDWTAGCLLGLDRGAGNWYVLDVRRKRGRPEEIEGWLATTRRFDDDLMERHVPIRAEEGRSGDGAWAIKGLADGVFVGFDFFGVKPKGSKEERATPCSLSAGRGKVFIVEDGWAPGNEEWMEDFLIELELFPDGAHDDMVDCFSGAWKEIAAGSVDGGGYEDSSTPSDGELGHAYDMDEMVGMTGA